MYLLTDDQFNTIYNMAVQIQELATDNLFISQSVADTFDEISGLCDITLNQIDQIQETHTNFNSMYKVGNIIRLKDAVFYTGEYLITGVDYTNGDFIYYVKYLPEPSPAPGDYMLECDAIFVRESL